MDSVPLEMGAKILFQVTLVLESNSNRRINRISKQLLSQQLTTATEIPTVFWSANSSNLFPDTCKARSWTMSEQRNKLGYLFHFKSDNMRCQQRCFHSPFWCINDKFCKVPIFSKIRKSLYFTTMTWQSSPHIMNILIHSVKKSYAPVFLK